MRNKSLIMEISDSSDNFFTMTENHLESSNDRNLSYTIVLSMEIVGLTIIYLLDGVIIIGNGMVVLAFSRDMQLRRVTRNYYIHNLAVCDLIIGLVIIPLYSSTLYTGDWPLGDVPCYSWSLSYFSPNMTKTNFNKATTAQTMPMRMFARRGVSCAW